MPQVTVIHPLHEGGITYQPGEQFSTSRDRAARLAELRLVTIIETTPAPEPAGREATKPKGRRRPKDRAMASPPPFLNSSISRPQ